jgi:hypothetical protein
VQGSQAVPRGGRRYGFLRGVGSRSRSPTGLSALPECYDGDAYSSSSSDLGSGGARSIRGVSYGGSRGVSLGVGGSGSGSAAGASKLLLSKRYDLDDSSSSSSNLGSGGRSDDDSMPEEGAPLAKPDKDGVAPLALFGEELAILEGF